jgi:hypothetical protein
MIALGSSISSPGFWSDDAGSDGRFLSDALEIEALDQRVRSSPCTDVMETGEQMADRRGSNC